MLLIIINTLDSYSKIIDKAFVVKKTLKLLTSTHFTLHTLTVCTRQLIPVY